MLNRTDYRELHFTNLGKVLLLPKRNGLVVFETFERELFTQSAGVCGLLWRLHSLATIENIAVLVNPPLRNEDTAISSENSPELSFLKVPASRLGDLRLIFDANRLYGDWTFLGYVGAPRSLSEVLDADTLDDYEFAFEVDLDAGLRGFGPDRICDGGSGLRVDSRAENSINALKTKPAG